MLLSAYWIKILTGDGDLRDRRARAQCPVRARGPRLAGADRAAVDRGLDRREVLLPDGPPVPVVLVMAGVLTGVVGTLVGLPALRLSGLLSRPDHADVRRAGRDRPADHGLPERRRRLPRAHRLLVRKPVRQAPEHRRGRRCVLPLHARRHGRDDVPARPGPRLVQGGPCLGGHSPERAGCARGEASTSRSTSSGRSPSRRS